MSNILERIQVLLQDLFDINTSSYLLTEDILNLFEIDTSVLFNMLDYFTWKIYIMKTIFLETAEYLS